MGETKTFQICHQGDLTLELVDALRRLGAEPNFDSSWQVVLSADRSAGLLLRFLRRLAGPDSSLLVAESKPLFGRDFLLVRHSITPGYDYAHLQNALHAFGELVDIPFETTFLIRPRREQDSWKMGETLTFFCPDDSLMVTGVSADLATHSPVSKPRDETGPSASLSLRPAGFNVA